MDALNMASVGEEFKLVWFLKPFMAAHYMYISMYMHMHDG